VGLGTASSLLGHRLRHVGAHLAFAFGCSPTTGCPCNANIFLLAPWSVVLGRLRNRSGVGTAGRHAQRVLGGGYCHRLRCHRCPAKAIPECRKITWCSSPFCCRVDWLGLGLSLGDAAELAFDQLRHDDFVGSHGDFVGKRVHIHATLYIHVGEGGPRCGFHGMGVAVSLRLVMLVVPRRLSVRASEVAYARDPRTQYSPSLDELRRLRKERRKKGHAAGGAGGNGRSREACGCRA